MSQAASSSPAVHVKVNLDGPMEVLANPVGPVNFPVVRDRVEFVQPEYSRPFFTVFARTHTAVLDGRRPIRYFPPDVIGSTTCHLSEPELGWDVLKAY